MKIAIAHLKGTTPYSQSKPMPSEKRADEDHDAYDLRCWREHLHVGADGRVFIPPMQFKQALDAGAARLTKTSTMSIDKKAVRVFIEPGVIIIDPLVLPVKADEVACERLFLNSDGKPAKFSKSGRVWRRFPVIPSWSGAITLHVLDPKIGKGHVEAALVEAGNFVGIGRWRVEKRGMYGRFVVERVDWQEVE